MVSTRRFGYRPTLACALVLFGPMACANTNQPGLDPADQSISEHPSESDIRGHCNQFESYSGRAVIGTPSNPETNLDSIEPGQSLGPTEWPRFQSASVERKQGTDRIVFETLGEGTLAWSGRFVQSPHIYSSDEPAEVSGTCILQIDLTGFDPKLSQKDDPQRLATPDTSAIVEAFNYPVVEGLSQTFVGTRTPTPRVSIDTTTIENRATVTVTITD